VLGDRDLCFQVAAFEEAKIPYRHRKILELKGEKEFARDGVHHHFRVLWVLSCSTEANADEHGQLITDVFGRFSRTCR
jgi:hypothetical protein